MRDIAYPSPPPVAINYLCTGGDKVTNTFGDKSHCYTNVSRPDIVEVDLRWPGLCDKQHCGNQVVDVQVGLLLSAIAEHRQPVFVGSKFFYEIQDYSVGSRGAYHVRETKDARSCILCLQRGRDLTL